MTWSETSLPQMAAPHTRRNPARMVSRRSVIAAVSHWSLLQHCPFAVALGFETNHLAAGRSDQVLAFRQLFQAVGAEQFRLLQLEDTAFVYQAALLGAQRFELVAGQSGPH